MIRNALLAATAALLISSIPVFADSGYAAAQGSAVPPTTFDQLQSPTAVKDWVGKNGWQLEMALGTPSYESVATNGDTVYAYVEHGVGFYTNGEPATIQLQFEVASNGNIVDATTNATM
jgi:hypothetical protein